MNFKDFLKEEYLITIKTPYSDSCEIWKNPNKSDFKGNLIRAFLIDGNIYAWEYNSGFHVNVLEQLRKHLKNINNIETFYGKFKPILIWNKGESDLSTLIKNKNIIKLFGKLKVENSNLVAEDSK